MDHKHCNGAFWVVIFCFFLATTALENNEGLRSPVSSSYGDALSKAILFFEGQRSGQLPADQRVKWRAHSALSVGLPDKVNLAGGYYDAGDNVKFTWTMPFTVSLLSWSAIEYQKEISSVNQLGFLQTAIRG